MTCRVAAKPPPYTVYRHQAGHELVYWCYFDGRICRLSEALVLTWQRTGQCRIRTVEHLSDRTRQDLARSA